MKALKFWGHCCFQIKTDTVSILFNPFPSTSPMFNDYVPDINTDYIFITHGEFDHLDEAIAIAKHCDATIVATRPVAKYCQSKGCKAHSMNLGGKHTFDFGYVRMTLAFHTSGIPGGHACGYIINLNGINIYYAGATALFGDMALLGRLERIDYAILPIGDNDTMGPADAVEAAGMLHPRLVIPMRYNTWPSIAQDPVAFKDALQQRYRIAVQVVNPGEEIVLSKK